MESTAAPNEFVITQTEICTSLRLQMLLYFGGLYKMVMAVLLPFCGYYKSHFVEAPLVYVFFFISIGHVFIFEPFRYYLGYRGNLNENVPHLFLFLILTVFPCICVTVAIVLAPEVASFSKSQCGNRDCILPLEKALFYVDGFFVVFQLWFSVSALRRLIAKNTEKFYLSQDESVTSEFEGSQIQLPFPFSLLSKMKMKKA